MFSVDLFQEFRKAVLHTVIDILSIAPFLRKSTRHILGPHTAVELVSINSFFDLYLPTSVVQTASRALMRQKNLG